MMRKVIIPVLALAALLLFSCNKKQGAAAPVSEAAGEIDTGAAADEWNDGYVLRVNSSFYIVENDTGEKTDKTKWDAQMALGEKVSVGEVRELTFSGDGKVYDFVKIRRHDGKEGYAWTAQVVAGGELAVVVDERGNMFRSPRSVDVTGIILPRKVVGVRFPETESEGFVEIRAYDPGAQATRQNFIRTSSLSLRQSDIQASILLQTAEPLKNEGAEKIRRDALLESALLDYPGSAFSADIQALANPGAAAIIATEPADRPAMTVNDDNVNVRDIPDTAAGRVVGTLNRADEVTVIEQISAPFTIEGQSARWYRISEPVEGWVFGVYLE